MFLARRADDLPPDGSRPGAGISDHAPRPSPPREAPGSVRFGAGGSAATTAVGAAAESDAQVVARVAAGDRDAFRILVERYQGLVYTHVFRIVRQEEDAEDVAQEAFLRAYERLDRFDRTRPFAPWLVTLATRLALNHVRDRSHPTLSLDAPAAPATPSGGPSAEAPALADAIAAPGESPHALAATEELRRRIDAAMLRLPPQARAILQLRAREGLSIAEIAAAVGLSETATKVALHRARETLREWISPR